jgi:hypothetical protein
MKLDTTAQFIMAAAAAHTTAAPKNTSRPGREGGWSSLGLCHSLVSVMKISGHGSPA